MDFMPSVRRQAAVSKSQPTIYTYADNNKGVVLAARLNFTSKASEENF